MCVDMMVVAHVTPQHMNIDVHSVCLHFRFSVPSFCQIRYGSNNLCIVCRLGCRDLAEQPNTTVQPFDASCIMHLNSWHHRGPTRQVFLVDCSCQRCRGPANGTLVQSVSTKFCRQDFSRIHSYFLYFAFHSIRACSLKMFIFL
jgi:hypothetical protein